mgnify:CR=1 FL=1
MKLLEVFKDFQVEVIGSSQHGRYRALYIVEPKPNHEPITVEDLKEYVEKLRQKYPDRGFYLRKYKNFIVLTQKTVIAPRGVQGEIKRTRKQLKRYMKLLMPSPVDLWMIHLLREKLRKLSSKVKVKKDAVPIYFDLESQKIYVPKTYVERKPKLVNYILMRTLGALGVARTRYDKIIGRT